MDPPLSIFLFFSDNKIKEKNQVDELVGDQDKAAAISGQCK